MLHARNKRLWIIPILYSIGKKMLKFKQTPLKVFLRYNDVINLLLILVREMSKTEILFLDCSSQVK